MKRQNAVIFKDGDKSKEEEVIRKNFEELPLYPESEEEMPELPKLEKHNAERPIRKDSTTKEEKEIKENFEELPLYIGDDSQEEVFEI